MFFTQDDYKKIHEWLAKNSIKDTEFNKAITPLKGNEIIAFVQNGQNVKAYLSDFVAQLLLLGIPDFVNITDKYHESYITLSTAIRLIPFRSRKIGQVITFIDETGNWVIYQFQGKAVNQWNNETLWVNILQKSISGGEVTADEEDLTEVTEGEKSVLKFKDKQYNPDEFSGLGRVYLRKNITNVDGISMNLLTQNMLNKSNTIYIIQYDYDLNGQTITVPEGCVLKFEGGSLNNGTLGGNNTDIINSLAVIFNNINIEGTFKIPSISDLWFSYTEESDAINLLDNLFKLTSSDFYNIVTLNRDYKTSLKNAVCIRLNSNTELNIKGKIELIPSTLGTYAVIAINNSSNITINGGTLIGDIQENDASGEWGMGIRMYGCKDVIINNSTISYMVGDGIYAGAGDESDENTMCSNIRISGCNLSYNGRQGISFTAVKDSIIENCNLEYTGAINGKWPKSGIDLEPNDLYNMNILVDSCSGGNNSGAGYIVSGDNRHITIRNCTINELEAYSINLKDGEDNILNISGGYLGGSVGIYYGGIINLSNCSFDSLYLHTNSSENGGTVHISNCTLAYAQPTADFFTGVIRIDKDAKLDNLVIENSIIDYSGIRDDWYPDGLFQLRGSHSVKNIIFRNNQIKNDGFQELKLGDYYNNEFHCGRIYLHTQGRTVYFKNNKCYCNSSSTPLVRINNTTTEVDYTLYVFTGNTIKAESESSLNYSNVVDISSGGNTNNPIIFEDNFIGTNYIVYYNELLESLLKRAKVSFKQPQYNRLPYIVSKMSSLPTCYLGDEGTQVYDKSTDLLYFYNGSQFKNSDGTLTSKVVII